MTTENPSGNSAPSKAPHQRKRLPRKWTYGLGALALAFATGAALPQMQGSGSETATPLRPALVSPANAQAVQPQPFFSFADIVEDVQPTVVSVVVRGQEEERQGIAGLPDFKDLPEDHPFRRFYREFEERFGGQNERRNPQRRFGTAQGSGFFVSADGYVVTNNHVVANGDQISIRMHDGEEYDAELVGTDSRTDLALLKVEGNGDFPFVKFTQGDIRVGDWVLAVGNPFGLGGTVTAGIVSARGRDLGSGPYDDFIQIDAPVNRGNSGGPTFNLSGEVVGVNTAIFSPSGGNVGIAFAIPANLVEEVISDLQSSGRVLRGWLGVQIQPVTPEIAEGLGMDSAQGALISGMVSGSPAGEAGMRRGDAIVKVDDEDIDDARDLARTIGQFKPDDRINVQLWRNGELETIEVRLGTQPVSRDVALEDDQDGQQDAPADLGIDSEAMLGFAADPNDDGEGVVITDVLPGSGAAERGLRAGDVVLELNGVSVNSADDLAQALSAAESDDRDTILALIQRDRGGVRYIPLPIQR